MAIEEGYGGYKYIPGRWTKVAQEMIKRYDLKDSKILDIGCGKGYLLYEFQRLLPNCEICGIDVSSCDRNSKERLGHF